MGNIAIISENRGFLITSIQEQLEAMGASVFLVDTNIDAINAVPTPLDAILIYISEELLTKKHSLVYLRDKAVEEGIGLFEIGTEDEISEIESSIPKLMVKKVFYRPIDVKKLTQDIGLYLKEVNSTQRKKILVVDDSGAMLRSVKSWLEEKYQVILANSGMMAIKYLTTNHPDLVLLDYEMPVCDGKQVLGMIRAENDFKDIPVIFLTSKDDRESVLNVMALKPNGYLLKTLPPEKIVQSVDDFFANQKWQHIAEEIEREA